MIYRFAVEDGVGEGWPILRCLGLVKGGRMALGGGDESGRDAWNPVRIRGSRAAVSEERDPIANPCSGAGEGGMAEVIFHQNREPEYFARRPPLVLR